MRTELIEAVITLHILPKTFQESLAEYHTLKVTDSAGDLWAPYKDTNEKLYQIQVGHF